MYTPSSKKSYMVYTLTQYFRGFTVVWIRILWVATSTRIYVICIAVVSKGHVPVCITRKITRAENDMVLILTSKLAWLLCVWSKETCFQCGGSELTWVQCMGWCWLGLVWGSKMTGFRVWIDINLFLVSGGHRIWLVFRVGINIYLTSVLGSKINWLLCEGSKLTWF